ncbi:MAG: hypothetical protein L0Y72_01720 [Gemmataceae bacterium]|nr:hypothetical protein [Gemmataceae bacterium]MCI0737733.1 hypothetical protein [Gemmataceae bacterium]
MTELERKVAEFLSDRAETHAVDFSFENAGGGFRIHAAGLARVADAIRQQRIRVCSGSLPHGAGGQYHQTANRVGLDSERFPRDRNGKAIVLHEAVHALMDLSNVVAATRLSDEAAAYLTQVIYLYYKGRRNFSASTLLQAAYDVAVQSGIIDPPTQIIQRGVRISWHWYAPLRQAIQNHDLYNQIGWLALTGANGVPLVSQHPCTL